MAASSSKSELQAQFAAVRQQLACPACYGELRVEQDRLVCSACGRAYPIVDGIPVLIAEQGSHL